MAETTTKERPINLKAWEVKALMDGRLSQLRRVIKCNCNSIHIDRLLGDWGLSLPPHRWDGNTGTIGWRWKGDREPEINEWVEAWQTHVDDHASGPVACPFKIGDRLWVRETWALVHWWEEDIEDWLGDIPIEHPTLGWQVHCKIGSNYASDYLEDRGFRWRSPLSMPRWASRITLEITGLGVERIQDITETEAELASGHETGIVRDGQAYDHFERKWCSYTKKADPNAGAVTMRGAFAMQWDRDNGTGSWDRNEWAWVLGVRRLEATNENRI